MFIGVKVQVCKSVLNCGGGGGAQSERVCEEVTTLCHVGKMVYFWAKIFFDFFRALKKRCFFEFLSL